MEEFAFACPNLQAEDKIVLCDTGSVNLLECGRANMLSVFCGTEVRQSLTAEEQNSTLDGLDENPWNNFNDVHTRGHGTDGGRNDLFFSGRGRQLVSPSFRAPHVTHSRNVL